MKKILSDPNSACKILQLTADTLLLITPEGICVDVICKSDLWFLQEEILLGLDVTKNLSENYRKKFKDAFKHVLEKNESLSFNGKVELKGKKYYYKCRLHPYDGLVLCQYRDITKRCNVEKELEQANRTLREIQKVAQIGHWSYNTKEKVYHYAGEAGVSYREIEEYDISTEQGVDSVVDEDREAFKQWKQRIIETESTESISFRYKVNNRIHYMRMRPYIHKQMPDGSVLIEGFVQNITDIQQQRNDIDTLKLAINSARDSIFAATEDGTLLFANRQFRCNNGLGMDEDIKHLKIYDVIPDVGTLENWKIRCQSANSGEKKQYIINNPSRSQKEILAYESSMYKLINMAGEVSYWSFAHDITERMRYISEMNRFNHILDAAINNLPASITVKDADNDFSYIYRNGESYYRNLLAKKSVDMNDFDFYPPAIAKKMREEDKEICATGKMMHMTLEGSDKNGEPIIVDKRKIKVEGDALSSPILLCIEWDITDTELMKRKLQESKEKAETSDKLKSAFLANMSHEIRTPLNAIVGFSHLISESDNQQERDQYFHVVEENNERLLGLINEILDLSKIESGVLEFTMGPVSLHQFCREVYNAHMFRMPHDVELVYEDSEKTLVVETDKNRLFQVLGNLIGNAIKFTTQGSISYGYKLVGKRVVFHVTDTGSGIRPEKMGRVFERFAKLNNHAQGTGLGLSICKSIMERLGGYISVSTEVGVGSTFEFALPYDSSTVVVDDVNDDATIDLPVNATAREEGARSDEKKPLILIAEDTESNYNLLYATLHKQYRLMWAHDGMEAVTLYDDVKPDLILMDVKMPNLDGLDATRIIRELSTTVPIIAISAYAYKEDKEAALAAGCSDFLPKPIEIDKLMYMINKWLATTHA